MRPVAGSFPWQVGRLALAGRDDDGSNPRGSGVGSKPASDPSSARLRVLLIEPAPVLRNIIIHALSVQGFEVEAVEEQRDLERRLVRFDPHVVVVEATLPDGGGERACMLIRRRTDKLVPVILMSGMPESELMARARSAGADRHFCKARGLSQLLDLVDELTAEIVF